MKDVSKKIIENNVNDFSLLILFIGLENLFLQRTVKCVFHNNYKLILIIKLYLSVEHEYIKLQIMN